MYLKTFRPSNLFLSLSNANLHFCFVFVCPELLLEFSGYIILIKYCSIFKEQLPLREDSLFILAHLSTFVNTFLKKFLFFLKNISLPFQSSFLEFAFKVPLKIPSSWVPDYYITLFRSCQYLFSIFFWFFRFFDFFPALLSAYILYHCYFCLSTPNSQKNYSNSWPQLKHFL